MRNAGKFIAIAALALLTGCGGNELPPEQESSQPVTAEVSSPEQTTAGRHSEAPAGAMGSEGQIGQGGNGGIDLVSEKYSDFDDVFKLNGEWCSLSDLLMTVDEFKPEGDFSDYMIGGVVGERIILERGDPGASFFETYAYDLRTNELKKICDDGGGFPLCCNDKYIVVWDTEKIGINVYDINTGELVRFIPEKGDGRIGFYSGSGVLNNNVLFFDGSVVIEGNGKILPAVFTCNLNSGKTELFKLNAYGARYGLGNVVMSLMDSGYDNYSINGTYYNSMGGFGDTYYPVSITTEDSDVVLGDRSRVAADISGLGMVDIGVVGYFYDVSSGVAFNKDGLFRIDLVSPMNDYLIIGRCDLRTGAIRAARDTDFLKTDPGSASGYSFQTFDPEGGIWSVDIHGGQLRAVHIREVLIGENRDTLAEKTE